MEAHLPASPVSPAPPDAAVRLAAAREILHGEAEAIVRLAEVVDGEFLKAVDAVLGCSGQVVISGMGKAGLIGRKISATLASTGTRSIFLHPAEAVHGDLGRVDSNDILLLLSYSGETDELNRLLPTLRAQASMLIAITSSRTSTLGSAADIVLPLGALREVCPLGLAPSTSTTAMLALGDALALMVSRERGFTREAFARNHPAGSLGRKLAPVDQVMRPLDQCRVAHAQTVVCDVLVSVGRPGRRTGAVMLVDDSKRLVGIFTDSDLARLLEQKRRAQLDGPIADVMTTRFRTIDSGAPLTAAIDLLASLKISELPVVDAEGSPVGMIDITDVVGLVAQAEQLQQSSKPPEECCVTADGQLISVPITKARRGER
ncbi:MAG: KpsF/GutQ family sugar-phosphate isomerase [Aureliella sp.]